MSLLPAPPAPGKTRLLEVVAAAVIRSPGAVVILDPKGDRAPAGPLCGRSATVRAAPLPASAPPSRRSRRA